MPSCTGCVIKPTVGLLKGDNAIPRTLNPTLHTVRPEAFVDAGRHLIQTKGYEAMSVQDVLDALDTSRGAFYHYFDSKQALLDAVIDVYLLQGFQDMAIEQFLDRQAGILSFEEVHQTATATTEAFERILVSRRDR